MNPTTIQYLFMLIFFCATQVSSQNVESPLSPRIFYQPPSNSLYKSPFADFLATMRPDGQSNGQNQNEQKCSCGIKNTENRIVGGKEANPFDYSWMVAIYARGSFLCGGTMINDNTVLTAAHCILSYLKNSYTIKINIHNLNNDKGIGAVVGQIHVHEKYDDDHLENDIALLILTSKLSVTPVCLDRNSKKDYARETGIILGWGRTSEKGKRPDGLQEANINIISRDECKKALPFIYDYNVCTREDNKDACQGDSGGPLLTLLNGKYYNQIGVVSWGIGCARPGYPGVYTGVANFIPWIQEKIGNNIYTCQ